MLDADILHFADGKNEVDCADHEEDEGEAHGAGDADCANGTVDANCTKSTMDAANSL